MFGAIDAAGAEKDLCETNLNDDEVLEAMQRDMDAALLLFNPTLSFSRSSKNGCFVQDLTSVLSSFPS